MRWSPRPTAVAGAGRTALGRRRSRQLKPPAGVAPAAALLTAPAAAAALVQARRASVRWDHRRCARRRYRADDDADRDRVGDRSRAIPRRPAALTCCDAAGPIDAGRPSIAGRTRSRQRSKTSRTRQDRGASSRALSDGRGSTSCPVTLRSRRHLRVRPRDDGAKLVGMTWANPEVWRWAGRRPVELAAASSPAASRSAGALTDAASPCLPNGCAAAHAAPGSAATDLVWHCAGFSVLDQLHHKTGRFEQVKPD